MRKNTLSGFSLVEILLSLLIVSLILFIAIPALTMKAISIRAKNKMAGTSVAYYFNTNNNASNLPCYITEKNGSATQIKNSAGSCEVYDFIVPNGVYKADFTLVAGGGGGGGASGGIIYNKIINDTLADSTNSKVLFSAPSENIQKIKIEYLTAKGANGGGITGSKSGAGGASSAGIVNFEIPSGSFISSISPSFINPSLGLFKVTFSKAYNAATALYTSSAPTFTTLSKGGSGLVFTSMDTNSDGTETKTGNALGIFVSNANTVGTDTSIECFKDTILDGTKTAFTQGYYTSSNSNLITCGLTDGYYKLSQSGVAGTSFPTTTTPSGYTVKGGEGGKIEGIYSDAGKGGTGKSGVLICSSTNTTCTSTTKDALSSTAHRWQEVAPAESTAPLPTAKISIDSIFPGGTGSGGVGGSAIKINNLSVKPGQKYKIVVGSGGNGGSGGYSGLNKNGILQNFEGKGKDGIGGSSTAIYDEAGNLVVMVIGGVGGKGGALNDGAKNLANGNLTSQFSSIPTTAQNHPVVIIGSTYTSLVTTSNFDTNLIQETASPSEGEILLPDELSSATVLKLKYKFLYDTTSPMFELSTQTAARTGNGVTRDYDKVMLLSGFSQYINFGTSSDTPAELSSNATAAAYNGVAANTRLYHGFFRRYSIDRVLSYAGGLGGFSGIGSKGGCGGLFVGNKNGDFLSSSAFAQNDKAKGTITVNIGGTTRVFNINDLYSNCTILNSDGAMAEFVPPTYSSGSQKLSDLGQAGSGGGGGGWNPLYGAGKGGRGQNGYVFINWRKK